LCCCSNSLVWGERAPAAAGAAGGTEGAQGTGAAGDPADAIALASRP